MKSKKAKNNNRKKIAIIILITLLLTIAIIIAYKKLTPIYNVSDRTQNVYKKRSKDDTVIGWVRVQGTNIDYPVVYSKTDKFENDNYEYEYVWTNSDSLKLNSRAIVWGHNLRNVSNKPLINQKEFSGFENLPSYLYYDFVKQNKYIQYTINGKNYIYKIFAVSMVDRHDFSNNEYMNEKERKEYIDQAKKDSYFNFDIDVDSSKNIITVATCTRFYNETSTIMKIDGVLVDENEKLKNYKVTPNKNYEEIEKTMKGDEKNESEEV